jgi:hypothetical protein
MPKQKGLGRDVNKSLEVMDNLTACLKEFAHMPLKKGLSSNRVADEQLIKMINKASEDAYILKNAVDDLKEKIRGVKINLNSRFANRVVQNFLNKT